MACGHDMWMMTRPVSGNSAEWAQLIGAGANTHRIQDNVTSVHTLTERSRKEAVDMPSDLRGCQAQMHA